MPSICSSYMITGELHLGCQVETLKPWLAGYTEAWLSQPWTKTGYGQWFSYCILFQGLLSFYGS